MITLLHRTACALLALGLPLLPGVLPCARAQSGCVEDLPQQMTDAERVIDTWTCVHAGTYRFGNLHIVRGGTLEFADEQIDFSAANILVENGGTLRAGSPAAPIGSHGGRLVIRLWGEDPVAANPHAEVTGVICQSDEQGHCGIPDEVWNSNLDASGKWLPANSARTIEAANLKETYPNAKDDPKIAHDYFYSYHPLPHAGGRDAQGRQGYFGSKVLGVAYGGTLELYGRKGASFAGRGECGASYPTSSASSWARLAASVEPGANQLQVDRPLSFSQGDEIVLTSTDYLPGHSETLTVGADVSCVTSIPLTNGVQFAHNGKRYSLGQTPLSVGPTRTGNGEALETRAAVGVLSRSIQIASAGDHSGEPFPDEASGYYYGGHVVIRQGFAKAQIQGVEFRQLGQGGVMGRYPVHFHLVRHVPQDTFLRDSSINESMTRWVVLHGAQNVYLERNIGYKSIGHGFYLEDGTETDNVLTANLGVFARAAVDNAQNPRKVPGILALDDGSDADRMPFKSDYDHPTVFWIMNGWNRFTDNMAVGAGTCGACYWLLDGANSGMSRSMKWTSYASMQSSLDRAGMTPLQSFEGNFCSTAMTAFQTVTATSACHGVQSGGDPGLTLRPVSNPLVPQAPDADYYPLLGDGGRFATQCSGEDCSTLPRCGGDRLENCMVTVLDRFNTSFNWATFNFAAIWLRPQWYLVTDSVITDVQQAGLTMVTGGGYSESDVVPGHWALVRKSAFVGSTQPDNPYASDGGPFNPQALECATDAAGNRPGNYCLSKDEGISHQIDNFGMYQRMFSVYDGPAWQESNAYLEIHSRTVDDCSPFVDEANRVGSCQPAASSRKRQSAWLAGTVKGLLRSGGRCYMPNAAIGWKQPNGFYYPPAFHSRDLYFENVDTRHYVITPFYKNGSFETDYDKLAEKYCVWDRNTFVGFAGNDRQTVLNDDDGTLTGFVNSTVVNNDQYFAGPIDSTECKSAESSRTSPYHFVTTVIYPTQVGGDWSKTCTSERCYGVPLIRQNRMEKTDEGIAHEMRMMGQETGQRSSLTVNGGTYFIDTSASGELQDQACHAIPGGGACDRTVFRAGETYHLFQLYADQGTSQTYRIYVGADFDPASIGLLRAHIGTNPPTFAAQPGAPTHSGWYQDDPASGIYEITFGAADFPAPTLADQQAELNYSCQPRSFCRVQGEQCVSADGSAEHDAVCSWARALPDCPPAGCPGFSFTLPASFNVPAQRIAAPEPTCVQRVTPWDTPLRAIARTFDGCPDQRDVHPEDFCAGGLGSSPPVVPWKPIVRPEPGRDVR